MSLELKQITPVRDFATAMVDLDTWVQSLSATDVIIAFQTIRLTEGGNAIWTTVIIWDDL